MLLYPSKYIQKLNIIFMVALDLYRLASSASSFATGQTLECPSLTLLFAGPFWNWCITEIAILRYVKTLCCYEYCSEAMVLVHHQLKRSFIKWQLCIWACVNILWDWIINLLGRLRIHPSQHQSKIFLRLRIKYICILLVPDERPLFFIIVAIP